MIFIVSYISIIGHSHHNQGTNKGQGASATEGEIPHRYEYIMEITFFCYTSYRMLYLF